MGIVTSRRSFRTISNILSVVVPALRARRFAPCMTGPSAVGSEKGIPSSIKSAPAAAIAFTTFAVVSKSGSPQVINGIKALPFSKAFEILLMDILPSIAGYCRAVFIAPTRNSDYEQLILGKCRPVSWHRPEHGRSQ